MNTGLPSNFEQLIDYHAALLKRVAATYEADLSKQEDLFQDICLAVWMAISAFKSKSSFKTYMLRIAHNVAVKHVTTEVKKGVYVSTQDQAYLPDTTTQGEENVEVMQLLHLVRQLPLHQREVFTLFMEGLSYQEIADVTGYSQANVGMVIMRIKRKLTEAMSNE